MALPPNYSGAIGVEYYRLTGASAAAGGGTEDFSFPCDGELVWLWLSTVSGANIGQVTVEAFRSVEGDEVFTDGEASAPLPVLSAQGRGSVAAPAWEPFEVTQDIDGGDSWRFVVACNGGDTPIVVLGFRPRAAEMVLRR